MAFDHYKRSSAAYKPSSPKSAAFRRAHSHRSRKVRFLGAWDTVGALGIPISFLGLLDDKDEFYDTEVGSWLTRPDRRWPLMNAVSTFGPPFGSRRRVSTLGKYGSWVRIAT